MSGNAPNLSSPVSEEEKGSTSFAVELQTTNQLQISNLPLKSRALTAYLK